MVIESEKYRQQLAAYRTEMGRRETLRSSRFVPVYFRYTTDVQPRDAESAFQGVMDVLTATAQPRIIHKWGPYSSVEDTVSPADSLVALAHKKQPLPVSGFGPQVDATEIGTVLLNSPDQKNPHLDVLVTAADLNLRTSEDGDYMNFVLGKTCPELASIISTARVVDQLPEGPLRDATLRRLARHEVGKLFGLPDVLRGVNLDDEMGYFCTNPCVMRQFQSVPALVNLTVEEHNNKVLFCGDCSTDLVGATSRYTPLDPQ